MGLPDILVKGKHFVVEADEYATEPKYDKKPKFLWQHPMIGVITNIEFDHPDLYSSMVGLRQAFLDFAKNIQPGGALIAYRDDPETARVLKEYDGKVITYGFSKGADFSINKITVELDKTFFWISANGTLLGEFSLNVSGEHNALNALAATIVCLELGLSVENIKKGCLNLKEQKEGQNL